MSIGQANTPGKKPLQNKDNKETNKFQLKISANNTNTKSNFDLNANNFLFHSIFEEAGVGMAIINKKSEIIKYNKTFLNLFGYTEEDVSTKDYLDIVPDNRKKQSEGLIKDLFELKINKYQAILPFINEKNKHIYLKITATILKDESGNPEYILGIGEDVTKLKRQEVIKDVIYKISNAVNYSNNLYKLIKTIKENLKSIIDSKYFFIALYQKESNSFSIPFIKDNKETFETFPANKTLAEYAIKQNKPLLLNYKDIINLQHESKIFIAGKLSKQWLGVPLVNGNNTIGIMGVQSFEDECAFNENDLTILEILSNQVSTSIQKMQSEDALKIERAYFKELFDSSPEAIAVLDNLGIIININNEFSNLFGYTKAEAINKVIEDLISTPESKNEVQNITSEIAKGKIIKKNAKRKRKDGQIVDVSIWGTPIMLDEGQIAIFVIYRDITDVIQNEKILKNAKEKAEESDKLKTAFLTNMSHEIRTPMNAIIGFTELLGEPGIASESKTEFVEQIHESSNALLKLIDDIIDISQIDAGEIHINRTKCNISKILKEVLSQYESFKIKENKKDTEILLHNPFGNKIAYIDADEFRLKQIINHLLNNAIKYTEKGFIEFGFDINQHDQAVFYVRDTGIGIPEDKIEIIFKHFNKIEDKSKLYRGTGIGLTITKKLVDIMGGKIWVESNIGIGSVFYFSLPDKVTLLELPQNNQMVFKNYNWAGKRILIAEDEDSNYEVLKASLSRTQASLERVTRGDDAIEKCKEYNFDLVLMDVKMPYLNGINATKEIKKIKPHLPIIAQTAYVLKNERDTCINAGCDDYIPKPIKSYVLLETISKYLNQSS